WAEYPGERVCTSTSCSASSTSRWPDKAQRLAVWASRVTVTKPHISPGKGRPISLPYIDSERESRCAASMGPVSVMAQVDLHRVGWKRENALSRVLFFFEAGWPRNNRTS